MTDPAWTHNEAGWYTHPELGGVCWEEPMPTPTRTFRRGWYWWPTGDGKPIGPFRSARAAIETASHAFGATGK
jgi:hypothetical protein